MKEYLSYCEQVRQDLTKSEREQRLLEGDNTVPTFFYTIKDAIDTISIGDWGADPDAAPSDKNIAIFLRNRPN